MLCKKNEISAGKVYIMCIFSSENQQILQREPSKAVTRENEIFENLFDTEMRWL